MTAGSPGTVPLQWDLPVGASLWGTSLSFSTSLCSLCYLPFPHTPSRAYSLIAPPHFCPFLILQFSFLSRSDSFSVALFVALSPAFLNPWKHLMLLGQRCKLGWNTDIMYCPRYTSTQTHTYTQPPPNSPLQTIFWPISQNNGICSVGLCTCLMSFEVRWHFVQRYMIMHTLIHTQTHTACECELAGRFSWGCRSKAFVSLWWTSPTSWSFF